jgi:Protein of unknown function (DUF2853)
LQNQEQQLLRPDLWGNILQQQKIKLNCCQPKNKKTMSKFQEALATYKAAGIAVDHDLLEKVAKSLGPSIYNADSSMVSGTDKAELATVKNSFLIKKLGLPDGPGLDNAIDEVVEKMGRSNPKKHRAVFYTLLVEKFGKQSVFN